MSLWKKWNQRVLSLGVCVVSSLALSPLQAAPRGGAGGVKRKANRPLLQVSRGYSSGGAYASLKWRLTLGMGGDVSPALADLDLDGRLDLLVPSLDGDDSQAVTSQKGERKGGAPALMRLTSEGEVVWRAALPQRATAGVTLGDVDRDGSLDILLACGPHLLCFDTAGREKWRRSFGATIRAQPTVADLEGDGKSEVIVGANDNRLRVLDSSGRDKWSFAAKSWFSGGASVSDLDGDGRLEVVAGSLDNFVYCFEADGRVRWRFETGDWVQGDVALADVDGDGALDVLAASDDNALYCLSALGTLKWRAEIPGEWGRFKPHLAVADLDGDGSSEVLVPTPDGQATLFSAFGDVIWTSAVGNAGPSSDAEVAVIGSPLIVDVSGDGLPEILWASRDGNLRVQDLFGREILSTKIGGEIESSPILADADGDGQWELYVGNIASARRDAGFLSCYEFSRGGKALWATVGGDLYRTLRSRNALDYASNLRRGGDYATSWEPFGIGYRPSRVAQPPRRLRVTALPLRDWNGNNDGALDPGETALWRIQVENLGKGACYDALLTLDLGRSFLKLDRKRAYLGWIAPGARKVATFRIGAPPLAQLIEWQRLQEAQARTPFRDIRAPSDRAQAIRAGSGSGAGALPPARVPSSISVSPRATVNVARRTSGTLNRTAQVEPRAPAVEPVATEVLRRQVSMGQVARLQVLESGVQAAVARARVFNMPPLPPTLKIARRQIIDSNTALSSGNGNGRLEAGESVILRLWLQNVNLTTARRATAILTSGTSDVLVSTSRVDLVDVVPFGVRQVDFSLRVARQVARPKVVLSLETRPVVSGPSVPPRREEIALALGASGLDLEPPTIRLASPQGRIASTDKASIVIAGVVGDASGVAAFALDGKRVGLEKMPRSGSGYRFYFSRPLRVGENVIALNATDVRGNSLTLPLRVVRRPAATAASVAAKVGAPAVRAKVKARSRKRRR